MGISKSTIAVIGLGYVGLPLAVEFGKTRPTSVLISIRPVRPGEKLYEELLIGDNPLPTNHARIMKAHEDFLPLEVLQPKLASLGLALDANDVPLIRTQLKDLVPGYQPDGEVVDWVWCAQEKEEANKS